MIALCTMIVRGHGLNHFDKSQEAKLMMRNRLRSLKAANVTARGF